MVHNESTRKKRAKRRSSARRKNAPKRTKPIAKKPARPSKKQRFTPEEIVPVDIENKNVTSKCEPKLPQTYMCKTQEKVLISHKRRTCFIRQDI